MKSPVREFILSMSTDISSDFGFFRHVIATSVCALLFVFLLFVVFLTSSIRLSNKSIINFDDRTLETIRPMQNTISFFKSANMTVIRLTNDMKTVLENYIARYMILNEEDDSRNTLICLILYEISKYRSEENSVKIRASISYINNVMQYISMHYSESVTLADLAAQFYISRAKLASDFSSSVGMTVKQYTTLVRMNVARGMILNGKSAAETALACGYNNTGNFIATFTKYFGDSPVRYRNAVSEKAT